MNSNNSCAVKQEAQFVYYKMLYTLQMIIPLHVRVLFVMQESTVTTQYYVRWIAAECSRPQHYNSLNSHRPLNIL